MPSTSDKRIKAIGKTMKDLLRLAVEKRQEEDEWGFAITEASREITWAPGLGVMLYVTPKADSLVPHFETSYVRLGAGEKHYPDGEEFRILTGDYLKAEDALEGALKAFTDRAHGHSVREVEKRFAKALEELAPARLMNDIITHYRGQIAIEHAKEPK